MLGQHNTSYRRTIGQLDNCDIVVTEILKSYISDQAIQLFCCLLLRLVLVAIVNENNVIHVSKTIYLLAMRLISLCMGKYTLHVRQRRFDHMRQFAFPTDNEIT